MVDLITSAIVKMPINNMRCCVPGCRSKKQPSISFHMFPIRKNCVYLENKFGVREKVDRHKAWLRKLKMGTQPPRRAVVCSLHFTKQDYILPDCPSKRRRLKMTAVPSLNLPKTSHEAPTVKRRKPLQRYKEGTPVEIKAPVEEVLSKLKVDEIDPLYIKSCSSLPLRKHLKKTAVPTLNLGDKNNEETVEETASEKRAIKRKNREMVDALSTTKKSRKQSRQGKIPSRTTKTKSKKSNSIKNEGKEDQMDNDDSILFGPKVKEFENDNKFEVFYLDPEKEEVCTRKQSEYNSETDDASESGNGFDFDQEPLETRCQSTEQVSLGNICRVCSATSSLTHLTKCQSLVSLFVSITNIEIEVEDNLPKYMCAGCIQKLEDISKFICVAKKNDEKIKRAMLIIEEMKSDFSDNEDEELLNVTEGISNVSQEVSHKSPDVTIPHNIDLLKDKSKKPRLKKDEGEQDNIENKEGDHNKSSENQTSKRNDYFSDKKSDCVCSKCGEVFFGLRIPKVIENLPIHKLKFHCLNCSMPNESSDKEPTMDKIISRPFKANVHPKVYPGKTSSGEEKKIRCITCSESFAISEFVTHQLQTHSLKKNYTCKLCFSSFSHPNSLRRHSMRHT